MASPNFNHLARPYRWLEYLTFGPYLERTRFHFLNQLSTYRRALILGDGDGRFTTRLLAANPLITIEAVDSSATMLGLLTKRAIRLGPQTLQRLWTIHSDAQSFTPTRPYDLIVTHFFLDCLTEPDLENLIVKLRPHLLPRTTWLISEFAIPQSQPVAAIARIVIATLYCAFRILTGLKTQKLPDYAIALHRNGFSLTERKSFLGGLLTTELWHLDPTP